MGRYPLEDIKNPETGEIIVTTEELITEAIAEKIVTAGITKVKVRTVLECKTNMVYVANVMEWD